MSGPSHWRRRRHGLGILRVTERMQRVVGQSPNRVEDRLGVIEVPGDGILCDWIGEQGRDAEPEQAGALDGAGHQRMAD